MSLRKEKQACSPASLAFSRTPPKLDQVYTETVSDNLELGSRLSLVFSDKATDQLESEKPELRLVHETSAHNMTEISPSQSMDVQKASGIIGFWKHESVKSARSQVQEQGQPQKVTKFVHEGQNDIMSLKKFLLGPGKLKEIAIKSNANSLTPRPQGTDNSGFLDSQVSNASQRNNPGDITKRSILSYNIQGSPTTADTNLLNIPLTTQESETIRSSRSKSTTKVLLSKMKTIDPRELPRLVIQSPSNVSHQTKYMNALGKKSPKGLTGNKDKKRVFKNIRVLFTTFVNTMRLIKRRLRLRYIKNRKEVYKYDPKDDPPMIQVTCRNKELVKKRNKYCKEDKKFRERELIEIQEGSKVEYFDSSGFSSLFSTKNAAPISSNGNDSQGGRVVKSGFVKKVTNKSKMHHQRWIALRSFNIYCYKTPSSLEPKKIFPLDTSTLR